MIEFRAVNKGSTNLDVQTLADETAKLLRLTLDALYTTLGVQLLGSVAPTRVAGIISYLAAARSAGDAKALYGNLPTALSSQDFSDGLGLICQELRGEGIRYLSATTEALREALNNEDLLRLSDETSLSHIEVILMVVAAVLRLPRDLDTISATVTAIVLKQGLRNFCIEKAKQ